MWYIFSAALATRSWTFAVSLGVFSCLFQAHAQTVKTLISAVKPQPRPFLYNKLFIAPSLWWEAGYGKSVSEALAELRDPKDRHAVRFYSGDIRSSVHERRLESARVDIIIILSAHLPLLNVE
jgi:hypothetical protein